ncbi:MULTISPECIES: proteasome assembly chaperone family protein [Catenuloplanes]|uniref:ATP-grasp superfamily ATP-dependent carboligase n=2 Tax=Catenuloplanes TaxID=33874 RepID=A0AAE4CTP3_9ACTN|nr:MULTISPECIES: PAC2 family protein [Catenuloplanes]MDQ0369648.1 hypothetical protein [Catenuloplanes indicus]MDR7325541.1 hypothetical protein [Catenuloplanes niger]
MLDPEGLYRLTDDLPTLAELDEPVLVHAMTGFVDAGSASQLAVDHLLSTLDSTELATFDVDQLMDYRSRRPSMIFDRDHWVSYETPKLALHLVHDTVSAPFLLLAGPEPDLQWERYIAAVIQLIDRFRVRLTIGMTAIPMAVPHTRPASVTGHATRPALLGDQESFMQKVQVPAAIGNLLELRLGEQGKDAMGYAVHVPHYLAQTEYPAAAETLLSSVSHSTGLLLPLDGLRASAAEVRAAVDQQIAEDDQGRNLVGALEQQYDAFVRGRASNSLLASPAVELPTADELGAELERYLAEQARDDEK